MTDMKGFEDLQKELMVDDELYHFGTLTLVFIDETRETVEKAKDFGDDLGDLDLKMARDSLEGEATLRWLERCCLLTLHEVLRSLGPQKKRGEGSSVRSYALTPTQQFENLQMMKDQAMTGQVWPPGAAPWRPGGDRPEREIEQEVDQGLRGRTPVPKAGRSAYWTSRWSSS